MEASGQLHAAVASSLQKSHRYPLHRTLGGSQSRSGREEFPTSAGNRTSVNYTIF